MTEQPLKKKLLEQVRDKLRLKNYAHRTEKTYLHWIRRCLLLHHKRHPAAAASAPSRNY